MFSGDEDMGEENSPPSSVELEKLLEQKEYLDELIRRRFTRVITVMFTDMKGSTSMTEAAGDMVSRMVIKKQKDILSAIIKKNMGVLVKTMGDGTMSYFDSAVDAVRSAVEIHTAIEEHNNSKKSDVPIRLRIGLNTGTGIVEKNDVFGDVVNVASRFETLAEAGEIYISENTYDALGEGREEFYCRFLKMSTLKEKKGSFKVFKVFWNQKEIEEHKSLPDAVVPETHAVGLAQDDENLVMQKARDFEKNKEFVELYLLCEEHKDKVKPLDDIYQNLRKDLERYGKMETRFCGVNAVWFFKKAITMGRVSDADFYVSNQAMSRVPVIIGMKGDEGSLEIRSMGAKVKPVEVEKSDARENVSADVEYCLGKSGKVIFSVCFPFEYQVKHDRFITVKILDPEDCIRKHFNFGLKDVWKDFVFESQKLVIVGT